jgi:hypothetical protein
MGPHPLFDEHVVDLLRGVTDAFVRCVPDSVAAADILLRPGPEGREGETSLEVTYPEAAPPADWSVPEAVAQAGRDFAAAWLATGHPMPAFQFIHRREEDGNWKVKMQPLQDW